MDKWSSEAQPNAINATKKASNAVEEIVAEIKQEPMIKVEPEDHDELPLILLPRPSFTASAIVLGADEANKKQSIENSYCTHVKLELKGEADVNAEAGSTSGESKQAQGNNTSKGNAVEKQQTKKGNSAASKSPVGNSKKRGFELEGRAKAVIKAAQRKQSAAKRNKEQNKCPSCDHVAPSASHLKRHMLKHTGEKPFSCQICNKRFTQKSNLQRHLKTHSGLKYVFECSVCMKRFAQNDERSEHEATCNGWRFECHLCKKISTPNKSQLKEHMRVHTGDKPFRCGICSKKFTRKSNLKMHSKIHTNPRPLKFQCSVCARNFIEETEKDQHESKCQRRRYECYLCKSYMTYFKPKIMVHMRAHHTGAKPFRCEVCDKRFPQRSDLMRHLKRIHK